MKRLTGLKFTGSQHAPEISSAARKNAAVYKKHLKVAVDDTIMPPQTTTVDEIKEGYVHYQKELEAEKLLGSNQSPKQPGKILKLPTNRKEITFEG